MTDLEKTYTPQNVEEKIYRFWETNGFFKPEVNNSQETFSIVIPPPNVTGVLHMGHAIDGTLQDILIRYNRMLGKATLWVPGTDHAGIATQNVVEKELAKQGKTRHDLGREAFLEKVWEWVHSKKNTITDQIKRLGSSVDWSRERFTLDDGCSHAVKEVFISLYEKGLIYRGEYIVNWCPRCKSAISDIETFYKETNGKLWEIRYPFVDQEGGITVATTRPETMFGDVAVAVHPDSDQYKQFIGKHVLLPLVNKKIPVIADESVDSSFGTGAVKITPAHDLNDFETGKRHRLEPIFIMDTEGQILELDFIPSPIRGISREKAREITLTMLEEQGYLVSIQEHPHSIGYCQRCDTVIEPYLSKQWFVKMKPLSEKPIEAIDKKELVFVPDRWTKIYLDWMENIRDWCISRQLWWGHQIPAYYCTGCDAIVVGHEMPNICSDCGGNSFRQDEDVLDTWFSSALWPMSTMGWPTSDAADFKKYYPTNVLVTSFDIIFFWVARMVVMGYQFTNKSPFQYVYIHGLIRDKDGKKMSKSAGNTIDPVETIEKYGADALRYALTSLATYGAQDIKLSDQRFELARNFANKLWNASRFVLMNLEGDEYSKEIDPQQLTFVDQWILGRLNETIVDIRHDMDTFRIGEYAQRVYEFIWNDYCDWYVEFAKCQLNQEELKLQTQKVLYFVLNNILKLLHPVMPFITEEIWQTLNRKQDASIMIEKFPTADIAWQNNDAYQKMDLAINIIKTLRNIRQELNIPTGKKIAVHFYIENDIEKSSIEASIDYITTLVRVEEMVIKSELLDNSPPYSAIGLAGTIKMVVPLKDLIDIQKETDRQRKKMMKIIDEKQMLENKINNVDFRAKAPDELIKSTEERIESLGKQLKSAQELLNSMQAYK